MKIKDVQKLIKAENRLYDFAVEVSTPRTPKWVLEVHKCTNCEHVLTDPLDIIYMEHVGYCFYCGGDVIGQESDLMEYGGDLK